MRRNPLPLAALLCAVALFPVACSKTEQPGTDTSIGNATDRSANGTTGTGQPANVANDSAAAAVQLDTASTSSSTTTTAPLAVTGTEVINGAKTETTSTLNGPGTSTAVVATPTDTTATVKTPAGTKTTTRH